MKYLLSLLFFSQIVSGASQDPEINKDNTLIVIRNNTPIEQILSLQLTRKGDSKKPIHPDHFILKPLETITLSSRLAIKHVTTPTIPVILQMPLEKKIDYLIILNTTFKPNRTRRHRRTTTVTIRNQKTNEYLKGISAVLKKKYLEDNPKAQLLFKINENFVYEN